MADRNQDAVPVPPGIITTAKVDAKGRLNIPSDFLAFMRACREQRFFITTLDGRIARVYPLPVWEENEAIVQKCKENPRAAADVAFYAKANGAYSNLDKEGRILLPPNLRRELGLEGQQVWIGMHRGALEVYSQAVYQERMRAAVDGLADKVDAMLKLGFQ